MTDLPTVQPETDDDGEVRQVRPLFNTTSKLIDHVEECPACQYQGLRYCLDVDGYFNGVKRARAMFKKRSASG